MIQKLKKLNGIPWHSVSKVVEVIIGKVNHVGDIVISDKDKLGK